VMVRSYLDPEANSTSIQCVLQSAELAIASNV
jgi:hypothetical protein